MSRLIVETDSKVAADLIHKGVAMNPSLQFILGDIVDLLRNKPWEVSLSHVQRFANTIIFNYMYNYSLK